MTAGQFSDEAVGSQQSQLAAAAGRGAKSEAAAARKSHDEHRAVRLEEFRERYDSHCLGSGGFV